MQLLLFIENILLDDNKEPKIIDFGLSNLYDSTRLLETFCGSPKYAAPEIVTGIKYVGPTVDVWSLGVILYASLSGKLPFMGSTVEKMYKRILEGKVNYPTHFSPEVRDLIGKILKVKGEERLSMEEIMAHPWMNKGYDAPVSNYLPHRPSVVAEANEDVLEQTVAFGYARLEVLEAIVLEGYNSIKSTYFLVAERKERLDQLKRERMQVAVTTTHSNLMIMLTMLFRTKTGTPSKNGHRACLKSSLVRCDRLGSQRHISTWPMSCPIASSPWASLQRAWSTSCCPTRSTTCSPTLRRRTRTTTRSSTSSQATRAATTRAPLVATSSASPSTVWAPPSRPLSIFARPWTSGCTRRRRTWRRSTGGRAIRTMSSR